MRNIFCILVSLFTTLLTLSLSSCSKDETMSFDIPAEGIIIAKPGESGSTRIDCTNIASITATTVPTGWKVEQIDMYTGIITVKSPDLPLEEGEVESGTLSLKGYTPTGKSETISIHLAIVVNSVDYSAAPANCFVATQPDTRYIFNPMIGGSSTPINTAYVELLWETKAGLIKYLDMQDTKATFYIGVADEDAEEATVTPGNALIGGYDENGDLLWSWHVWVTNNDPTAAENVVALGGETMMNINLGAELNSNASTDGDTIYSSYGMYYQWGRKEPFVGPETYNFKGNDDDVMYDNEGDKSYIEYVDSTTEQGTTLWATTNPLAFIKGYKDNDYDWIYSGHEDALWSATTKSENDPCPAGWHVPDANVFENLTIAAAYDDMPWSDAQLLYGWMLVDRDSNEEYFFTAQGRRNYLDGRLDIINDDPNRPVPWSGYYWTASTDGNKAKAMSFDLNTATRTWNGFDAARSMHRANAMPIRCVKE